MTDLTAITTPFGLLDRETQEALKAERPNIEMFSGTEWSPVLRDWPLAEALAYRVKPAPPKPREWYVSGGNYLWDTYAEAYNACDCGEKPVHVREVLPE